MKAISRIRSTSASRNRLATSALLALVAILAGTTSAIAMKPPGAGKAARVPNPSRLPGGAPMVIQRAPTASGKPVKIPGPGEPRPVIKAVSDVKDFGTVWVGPDLTHSFTIKNEGDAALRISKVKPSCGCTIAGKYPTTLAPGESGDFPFKMASKKLHGRFEKGITISSNDPATPNLRLRLRGEVKRYVQIQPRSLNFGKLYLTEPREKVAKLTNNTDQKLELTLQDMKDPNFQIELVEVTPGQAYDLKVTAKPPFKPGAVRKTIKITTNIKNQKELQILLRGSIPERLEVAPTVITYSGQAKSKTGFSRVIRFTNYGEKLTKLLSATVDDPAITATINEQRPGKAYSITIQFPPDYQVPDGGRKITLKTDDAEKPVIEIPIRTLRARTATAKKPRRPAQDLVGKPAPAFSLTTTEGKELSTATTKGAVTVLDFFAVNCGFCKKQIPRLESIRKEFEGKGVRFVAVSQTMRNKVYPDQDIKDKVKELGFRGELAIDSGNTVGPLFKAVSFPTMAIIGKTGKVEAVNIGNVADLETRLRTQLTAMIAGKPVPTIAKATSKTKAKEKTAAKPTRKRPGDLIGKTAPKYATKTLDGKDVTNADLALHPATVLNFVAPNCGYCKKQVPRVEKLREKYTAQGVRFVNVVETMRKKYSTEEVVKIFSATGSKIEIAHDVDNKVGPLFGATGYPTMIVLGRSGKVEAANIGNIGDLEKRLSTQLDALIAGKPIPKSAAAPPAKRKRPADLLGKPAPKFATKTLDGKSVANADFAAHPATVLNFVAPNCGYCKKQVPRLEKIRADYAEKGVRFVNVVQTMRKKFTTEEVVKTFGGIAPNIEIAHDADNKIGPLFAATGYPTMIVVGKSGKVEAANVGNIGDLEKRLSGQLDALIAGKPVPTFATAKKPARRRPALDLVGKPAPAFSITTLDGKTASNSDFKANSATVLNFIAPNCGYCKKQLPNVEKVRKEYEAKGVRFVNVAQKMRKDFTVEKIQEIFKGAGSNLEISTSDFGANKVGGSFKAVSFPTMVVVGRDGKIAYVNIGAKADLEKMLKTQLDALIKG